MAEAWRSYLELAYGLTKISQKKAEKVVRDLVGKSNARAGELQGMAEDLLATSTANRDALTKLIRNELDRALERVGLAKAEEVSALQKRVAELETKLRREPAATAARKAEPAKRAAAKKTTVAKKAAPAKRTPARKTAAKKATTGTGTSQ
jgi:polyhydroxyalkanoate synthesis regulator phasin